MNNSHFQAKIYYLTSEEGGRKTAVNSGYRGQLYYDGYDWDAPQSFIDKITCNPGETVLADFTTLSPFFHYGKFFVDKQIEIKEGRKVVGRGKITKIYSNIFEKWTSECLKKEIKTLDMYKGDNLKGFIEDLHYHFSSISDIKKIKIVKNLDKEDEMINIDCELKDKFLSSRPFLDKICDIFEKNLSLDNMKLKLERVKNKIAYEIIFITWNENFLSGKITFKNSVYKK